MTAPTVTGYALITALHAELAGQHWRLSALCAQVDPDEWHPGKGGTTRPAKRVCAACPVRIECLEYALATAQRFGVWGGLSERERRRLTGGAA